MNYKAYLISMISTLFLGYLIPLTPGEGTILYLVLLEQAKDIFKN